MLSKFITRGIPKCSNCIYFRNHKEYKMGSCNKFLGSHNKPIDSEIARYNDLMCGYHGTQHKSGDLLIIKPQADLYYVMQPHI
jgi:hypothetical protein